MRSVINKMGRAGLRCGKEHGEGSRFTKERGGAYMAMEGKRTKIQDGYAADFRFLVMAGPAPAKRQQVTENLRMRFSKVTGLEYSMEYEELAEGGKNDAPHILTVPHKKHAPLVLEHGMVPAESRFANMKPGMRLGTWLTVILLDAKGELTGTRFWITDGIVTKREVSNLDAMGNSILIERFEIMHDGIFYTG